MLQNRKILVAVTGGIAAYKTCELVRLLMINRASVEVIMTNAATRFVAPLTFETLTGNMVKADLFADGETARGHLDVVRDIDLMVIAPATANCIGKLAGGIADDLVSTASLALSSPLLICPAMNPKMYDHPAVKKNLDTLTERGVLIMEPETGSMAHPEEEPGIGRLPEPECILDQICRLLPPEGPLSGITVTVTAGPRQEAIDPVRVISNLSSGRMGYALASEARIRGAEVHLIAGPGLLPEPPGVSVSYVKSTSEMHKSVSRTFEKSRVLIMAAAPSDFKVHKKHGQKIKKEKTGEGLTLTLDNTQDILKELSTRKGERLLVGFALETENGFENARKKLQEKCLDLIILNHPEDGEDAGLGKEAIQGTIIGTDGKEENFPVMSKNKFAQIILDRVQELLPGMNGNKTGN